MAHIMRNPISLSIVVNFKAISNMIANCMFIIFRAITYRCAAAWKLSTTIFCLLAKAEFMGSLHHIINWLCDKLTFINLAEVDAR